MATESSLVLGWVVSPAGDPIYWLNPSARPGRQRSEDLVTIPAGSMGAHSVVVAQSGSGKSVFVGRLIEELMVRTRARCVVFDPNADFWKCHIVEDADLWSSASYDFLRRLGRLPHERTRTEFARLWSSVGVRILTARSLELLDRPYARLQVWLPSLSVETFAEGLNSIERSEVYQCHAFVRTVSLFPLAKEKRHESLIDRAERLFELGKRDPEAFRLTIRSELSGSTSGQFNTVQFLSNSRIRRANAALPYISLEMGRYYFAKAREYQAARILATDRERPVDTERLKVVDLPSLSDPEVRFLMVNALLAEEWAAARSTWQSALEAPPAKDVRVPTFIVLEEAHNLAPSEAPGHRANALREQIRTIAAEGRKYGLYLILVSQRPDKLDPVVVSECENKALLRLDSAEVLAVTERALGLEGIARRTLESCLNFGIGRALMIGRWAPREGRVLYAAPRRTVEGGRSLRSAFWAAPPEPDRGAHPRKRPGVKLKGKLRR